MEWLTIKEAGDRMRIATETARRYARSGALRTVRVGRSFRTREDWIDEFMRNSKAQGGVDVSEIVAEIVGAGETKGRTKAAKAS